MSIRTLVLSCACAAAAASIFSARAQAQLVFGTTTTSTSNPSAIYLDVTTGITTTLWNSAANKKVNGAATDLAHQRLYTNDAARLNFWDFGNLGTTPTFIAGMYRTSDNVTFTATGVDSLAWASGKLYGGTSFQSTTYKRGIYQIATTSDGMATAHCVMTPLWLDPTGVGTVSGTIVLDGLDFNAADNLFYSAQTADTTATGGTYTRGIYTIDAFNSGALTKIADFPAGHTHIDGLAVGGGKVWVTEQAPADSKVYIFPYDLATQTYGTTISFALTDATQQAYGATWAPGALVPEPVSAGLVSIIGAIVLRRRK